MKVGVQLPEVEWEVPFPEYLAMARAAEEAGFDSIWVGDHLIYDLPDGARGPWEAWTTLAAIAAARGRGEIGPRGARPPRQHRGLLEPWRAAMGLIRVGCEFVLG